VLREDLDVDAALAALPASRAEVGIACERPIAASAIRAGKGQRPVPRLTGLSRFKKLKVLELDYVRLEPAALDDLLAFSLDELRLEWCTVGDWAWLSKVRGLRSLTIASCKLKRLPPLDELTSLRHACFGSNALKDLTPLASLVNLEVLEIGSNQIKDLAPLANLKKLKTLRAGLNNQIRSLAPLEGLKALRVLDIDVLRKERNRFGNLRRAVKISGQAFSAS
jgi:Leucine-rich repeat (LRR) protein